MKRSILGLVIVSSLAYSIMTNGHTVEPLPIDRTLEILRRHSALSR